MGWLQRRRRARASAAEVAHMVPLHAGEAYTSSSRVTAEVEDVGTVDVPSGTVAVGDLTMGSMAYALRVPVPPGRHRVCATTFVHRDDDGRERPLVGSVSLVVADGDRHDRGLLRAAEGGNARADGELHWVSVDSASCGFADADRLAAAIEDARWEAFAYTELASTPLPWAATLPGGGDLVAVRSGLGDGGYPVFGDHDRAGRLLAVHVNFSLVTLDDLAGVG